MAGDHSRPNPDFQIPSKERKSIPIIVPTQSTPANPSSTTIVTTTTSKPAPSNDFPKASSIDLSTSHCISDPVPVRDASLDIFSRNYVPLALQSINESTATLQRCPPFMTMDFYAYLASFLGHDFAQRVPDVQVPPPIPIPLVEQNLNIQNYTWFWLSYLQNEFAAQSSQYKGYSLFQQKLNPVPGSNCLYHLLVPGLREHAPRVDLGDALHVRPLLRQPEQHEVTMWLEHGKHVGALCPGFSGLLYEVYVWEIDRANERITVKIEQFNHTRSCNVIFLLQAPKLEPICRAVHKAGTENLWLRQMLFPTTANGVLQNTLSKADFDIDWVDDLNWEQKKAIHTVLKNNYGTMPYLISGPPGTGKTKTLVETALQLLHKPGALLVCAPSDAAADTLALRLSAHLSPNELFRLNGLTRTFAEVPDRLLLYSFSNDGAFSLPPVEKLLSFRIVVTTCRDADLLNLARLTNVAISSLLNGIRRWLSPESPIAPTHWTALLLDEAAQATEPDALIPLTVVMPLSEEEAPQFIAAGDQYQLGPNLALKSKLGISLFQRLFDLEPYKNHPLSRKHGIKPITKKLLPMLRPPFTNLVRNYRSHPAILSVPSSLFYNDTLITERKTSEHVLSWPGWQSKERWPIMFHQNNTPDDYLSIVVGDGTGAGTLYNDGEAKRALEITISLLHHTSLKTAPHINQKEIMIMSPFRAQVSHLRKLFRQNQLYDVNIGPLEAFQGLESRIVIICTTRTRLRSNTETPYHHVAVDKSRGLGLIGEPQRFNVAMTRAQEGLIVIGNAHTLISTGDKQWRSFLDFCRRNNCFVAPPQYQWPDLGGPQPQGRLERALLYAAMGKLDAENSYSEDSPDSKNLRARFKLKGPHQDMDEDMWKFKELRQLQDCENIDMTLEDASGEASNVDIEDQVYSDDYDRDLKREFHQECNTQ